MKKTKKLSLTTTKIRSLTDGESARAAGGFWTYFCPSADSNCQNCGTGNTCDSCLPSHAFTCQPCSGTC